MKKTNIIIFLIAIVLTSCGGYINSTNPYKLSMRIVDKTKTKKTSKVNIYDYSENNLNYFFNKGYVVKAKSAFRNRMVHISGVELAAKQIGSDVALYLTEFYGTASGIEVLSWSVPGETYIVNSKTSGNISINGNGNSTIVGSNGYAIGNSSSSSHGSYNSSTTTTIQGPSKYVYKAVPYSYNYYDQYALFLVKKYYWLESGVNIYKDASIKSDILTYIKPYEKFTIIKKNKNFIHINYNGFEGYLQNIYTLF